MKGRFEETISKTPDSYMLAIGWVILAVVAMVLVADALRRCNLNGWRGFSGSWSRASGTGRFNIGCTR